MTWIRSQEACGYLVVANTPRSDPPAKAGAGFGPFSLGTGNEAKFFVSTAFLGNSADAHGPSRYMSSLPSSVWPMYLAGETWYFRYMSAHSLMPASDWGVVSSPTHLPLFCTATWPPAPQMKLAMP